jgi:hypothetical protein
MEADPGSFLTPAPPPQRNVCGAERSKERQDVLDWLIGRMEAVHPQILIVSQQRWPVVGKDPSVPPTHGDLGVGDVGDASEYRPLLRRRGDPEFGTGLFYQGVKCRRGRPLDHRRIVVS